MNAVLKFTDRVVLSPKAKSNYTIKYSIPIITSTAKENFGDLRGEKIKGRIKLSLEVNLTFLGRRYNRALKQLLENE